MGVWYNNWLSSWCHNAGVMCQEYCDCVVCLHLKFDILLSRMQKVSFNKGDSEGGFEDEECDGGIDQNQQMFYFVDTLPSASLFAGNPVEPLYSLKVTYSVLCWWIILKNNYLELIRSQNLNHKKFKILPTKIILSHRYLILFPKRYLTLM